MFGRSSQCNVVMFVWTIKFIERIRYVDVLIRVYCDEGASEVDKYHT